MEDYLGTGGKTPDYLGFGKNPDYLGFGKDPSEKGRKDFSNFVKMKTTQKQKNRCAECFESSTESRMPQFHHKNRDKSDNSEENCKLYTLTVMTNSQERIILNENVKFLQDQTSEILRIIYLVLQVTPFSEKSQV